MDFTNCWRGESGQTFPCKPYYIVYAGFVNARIAEGPQGRIVSAVRNGKRKTDLNIVLEVRRFVCVKNFCKFIAHVIYFTSRYIRQNELLLLTQ